MPIPEFNVVTGAFSYTGRYIARHLLSQGKRVKTLTAHPQRSNPFGGQVPAVPFHFDQPDELRASLQGATTLYNTYWIRFPHGTVTFEKAVENTRTLIKAAEEAGVRRLVHISIANASTQSPLSYFRGKGWVEKAVKGSSLSYAIVRPTVIFGIEDILINNMAWFLRRFPIFALPGGDYRVQPVYVDDVATIAVRLGDQNENVTVDAVGPETYSFEEMVGLIGAKLGRRARIIHLSSASVLLFCRCVGALVGDVVLTQDELRGLMSNLLVSSYPPTGQTRLSEWLKENAERLGTRYASELERHYR